MDRKEHGSPHPHVRRGRGDHDGAVGERRNAVQHLGTVGTPPTGPCGAGVACMVDPWSWSHEAMEHFDVLGARFWPIDAAPSMTLLGVDRFAILGLMSEIEATAAD